MLALDPLALAAFLIIWGMFFLVTRLVSLSSIVGLLAPVVYFIIVNKIPFSIMAALIFILILIKHRENIQRLIQGKEKKI